MKRFVLAVICVSIGAIPASNPAGSTEKGAVVSYIFKGGDLYGQVLEAAPLTGNVDQGSNPNSLADGGVEDPNSKCSAKHYVGEFQGEPTPENSNGVIKDCGWGKLSLVPVGLSAQRSYAEAWTATETAHRVQLGLRDLGGSPNTDSAAQLALAVVALELLSNQLDELKQSGEISKDERDSIKKRLQNAQERIKLAIGGLAALTLKPAIASREASLVQLLILRSLVLAKTELTKMLQRMENAGLLPGAQ